MGKVDYVSVKRVKNGFTVEALIGGNGNLVLTEKEFSDPSTLGRAIQFVSGDLAPFRNVADLGLPDSRR